MTRAAAPCARTKRPRKGGPHQGGLALLSAAVLMQSMGCGGKEKEEPPVNPPSLPGNTSQLDIGTKVGQGRVIDVLGVDISSATRWSRVVPIDKDQAFMGGDVAGEAFAFQTKDRGRSWTGLAAHSDGIPVWSVGPGGSSVLSMVKRQIPKKPPPDGQLPPIDTVTFLFSDKGDKLSAPSPFLAPDPLGKTEMPTIPHGTGMAAVLGPTLASVVVERKAKSYAIAYGAGPGEASPPPVDFPKDESPIYAPFGRAPQLLSILDKQKQVLVRPWPKPGEAILPGKPIASLGVTKALVDELSRGPECDFGSFSFSRVTQPQGRTFVLGISPEKTVYFELPPTTILSSPMACSADRIVVEAINPNDKLASLVTCSIKDMSCAVPENRPFLKPWPEQHDRELHVALTQTGVVAVLQMKTKAKWSVTMSESNDAGRLYNLQRPVGEGQGNSDDGYDVGGLIGFGDRTLLLLSAKVNKTTRRSWYVLASDDGGGTWNFP